MVAIVLIGISPFVFFAAWIIVDSIAPDFMATVSCLHFWPSPGGLFAR
jgi:hypothetical protein